MATLAVAAAGAAAFLFFVSGVYPIHDWLLWTVLRIWGWQLLFWSACLAFGSALLRRLFDVGLLRPAEGWVLSAAVGVVSFGTGMFLAGGCGGLRPAWAVAWPLGMLVAGLLGSPGSLRTLARSLGASSHPDSVGARLVLGFGTLCLGLLYLGVFAPDAVNYDAAWTHLSIAQDYAREGRIIRFEADWPKNLAHMGSLINTWAFLLPGFRSAPERWMMALHTEFVAFLLTLVGVAAGVEWAVERPVRGAWTVMFLLPGIFVYDSNLGGAADHFAAFFVAPAFLAAVHAARSGKRGWWALFGTLSGAALVTKYQTFYSMIPLAALLGWSALRDGLGWLPRHDGHSFALGSPASVAVAGGARTSRWPHQRARWRAALAGPAVAVAALAAVAGPHFVRNAIFYRNPIYPFGQRVFSGSTPSMAGAALMAENIISHFGSQPPAAVGPRLLQALRLLVDFSLHPHAGYTGAVPVFGSLFTLSLPLALWVDRGRRIRLTALVALAALFLWAWTWRVDRNLQTFAPLLAIAMGAILARTWEGGVAARLGVAAMVAVQLAWGADHMFLGSDRVASAMTLIRSGFDGHAATRFDGYAADRIGLGRALPRGAKVLRHNFHLNLGIDRPTLSDELGLQGLIDTRTFRSPRDLYDSYRAAGITHVVFAPGAYPASTKQNEVLFDAFVDPYLVTAQTFGGLKVVPLPDSPPPEQAPFHVLAIGLGGYADGVYDAADLSTFEGMPADLQEHHPPLTPVTAAESAPQLASVNAVLLGPPGNTLRTDPRLAARFHLAVDYPALSVWIQNR